MENSCFTLVSQLECDEELLDTDEEVELSLQSPDADDDDAILGEGEFCECDAGITVGVAFICVVCVWVCSVRSLLRSSQPLGRNSGGSTSLWAGMRCGFLFVVSVGVWLQYIML